jgi:hypothetical protein
MYNISDSNPKDLPKVSQNILNATALLSQIEIENFRKIFKNLLISLRSKIYCMNSTCFLEDEQVLLIAPIMIQKK